MDMPHEAAKWVTAGHKTEHRIPARFQPRWRRGRTYSLVSPASVDPPLKRREWGRVTVTGIRLGRLHGVSLEDARSEGHKTRDQFLASWAHRWGSSEDQDVWVIGLEYDRAQPVRLLRASAPVRADEALAGEAKTSEDVASDRGYTFRPELALSGEAEPVDDETLTGFSTKARTVHSEVVRERRLREQARSLTAQIKDAMFKAERQGRDISGHVADLHRKLEEIQSELAA